MAMTATERQQHFVDLAIAHAEDFKTRVTQHDRENSFPFENVAAMKASGYTNMTVPMELGGGGANLLDFILAQEQLARGDGPTAVTINCQGSRHRGHKMDTTSWTDEWGIRVTTSWTDLLKVPSILNFIIIHHGL